MVNKRVPVTGFPKLKTLQVLLACIFYLPVLGQINPFFNNTTYLKTPLLQKEDLVLSLPVIKFGTDDQLIMRFDDLRGGIRDYSYTFVHCNADWQPSGLIPMDYLNGFETQFIDNYQVSFNTKQRYTQYVANFPNEQLSFTYSGNYLVQVWESGNDTTPVLQLPFYVWQELTPITGEVKQPSLTAFRNEYQRLMFEVDITDVPGYNPYEEIRIVVLKNYQLNQGLYNLKPRLVSNNTMLYDQTDLVFPGIKEFRRFDLRNIRLQSERVAKIERDALGNRAWISVDENRSYKRYSFENDINGRFLIDAEQTTDKNTEADYVMVHFSLESPFWMSNGDFYILGAFNQFTPNEESKMEYNFDRQLYEGHLLLKQGYYNYLYCFIEKDSSIQDYGMAEGNHFETMNDYIILVYSHDNLRNADELVGYSIITSFPR